MVVRPTALRPTKQAFGLGDPHVVDAGVALGHVAVGVEQPILIAVTAPPLPVGVMRFVDEAHRDAVLGERPQLLDQSIIEFSRPFAGEKRGDRPTDEEWAYAAGCRFTDDSLSPGNDPNDPSKRWLARYDREAEEEALTSRGPIRPVGSFGSPGARRASSLGFPSIPLV